MFNYPAKENAYRLYSANSTYDFELAETMRMVISIKEVHKQDIKGLLAFCEEHPHTTAIVVSQNEWQLSYRYDLARIFN